ncbi:probable ethanolamine kinase [Tanacetum coccineum]|uniref:ethanolamine kinase n=1 Tax=Tanacetum coccineum TaxID=301880 RepID=A0ABQ4Y2L1_9ASTR
MPPIPISVYLAVVFEREALEEEHWGDFCHRNYLELNERISEIQLGDIGKLDRFRAMVVESNQPLRRNPVKFVRKLTDEEITVVSNSADITQVCAAQNSKSLNKIELLKVLQMKSIETTTLLRIQQVLALKFSDLHLFSQEALGIKPRVMPEDGHTRLTTGGDISWLCWKTGFCCSSIVNDEDTRSFYKGLLYLSLTFDDGEKQKFYMKISFEEVEAEISLRHLNAPVVFAHNDLLSENLMLNDDERKLYFIDLEYGSYSYRGFDIGNHFNEYTGYDCDYKIVRLLPGFLIPLNPLFCP